MPRIFIFILFFFTSLFCLSQEIDIHNLTNDACEVLKAESDKEHKVILKKIVDEILMPKIEHLDEKDAQDFFIEFETSLYLDCSEYKKIVDDLHAGNLTSETIFDGLPKSSISQKTCDEFKKIEEFYYLESNGNKAHVIFTDDLWQDFFHDQTSTVNKVAWNEDCSFTLTFVRSDNVNRNKFIHPGDQFKYYVIEKRSDHYYLAIELPYYDNKYAGYELYFNSEN